MKTNIMVVLMTASLIGTAFAQSMGGSTSSGSTYGNNGASSSGGSSPVTNSSMNRENTSNSTGSGAY